MVEFFVHMEKPCWVAVPDYLGLPWTHGATFHLRQGARPAPWSDEAVRRLPLLAEFDVNFTDDSEERLGYLHYIRRDHPGKPMKGDGTVSAALVHVVRQFHIRFLVFHTALRPDGLKLVERLRPGPLVKAKITVPSAPEEEQPVWVLGEREAILRYLVTPYADGPQPPITGWFA